MILHSPSFLDPRSSSLAREWGVSITEAQETPSAHIAYGRRGASPVVLKVQRRPGDEWQSGDILRAFRGRGMVRLLEAVPGAVLMERLCPGTSAAQLTLAGKDDDAIGALAEVMKQFSPDRSPPGCPSIQAWGNAFSRYLEGGRDDIPRGLVERARAWYRHLGQSQRRPRLLHGDFHHYNVISDQKRGWVAIDPKGVTGELEYDLGAALRNPSERLADFCAPRAVERRLSLFSKRLRFDLERALAWAYSQAVLSAIWLVEDGQPILPGDPTLVLARRLETMLPAAP